MVHYYVDAYNVFFQVMGDEAELESARSAFLSDLIEKVQDLPARMTFVFDAQYVEDLGSRHHKGDVEIVFTDEGETADSYILSCLEREPHPKQTVVVTSDRRLGIAVRDLGAKTELSERFLLRIEKRFEKEHKRATPFSSASKIGGKGPTTRPGTFEYYLEAFEKRLKEDGA